MQTLVARYVRYADIEEDLRRLTARILSAYRSLNASLHMRKLVYYSRQWGTIFHRLSHTVRVHAVMMVYSPGFKVVDEKGREWTLARIEKVRGEHKIYTFQRKREK